MKGSRKFVHSSSSMWTRNHEKNYMIKWGLQMERRKSIALILISSIHYVGLSLRQTNPFENMTSYQLSENHVCSLIIKTLGSPRS